MCIRDSLYIGSGRNLEGIRVEFAENAKDGYDNMRTYVTCDPDHSGMFLPRTRGEVDYQNHLNVITTQVIETWRNQEIVSNDAWVWPREQICAEFRYLDRRGVYWRTFVRSEHRLWARHGRAIPYHCLATFNLRPAFLKRTFCGLTQCWSRIESPWGCTVALPPVFSYCMRELMDPSSGWRVVAYTDQAIKTAVYILMDLYYKLRLWSVSPHLARALGCLLYTSPSPRDQRGSRMPSSA